MRRFWLAIFVAITLTALGWGSYLGWQYLTAAGVAEVASLAEGDQEIAWIAPATNGDSWERLVAALKSLENDWPAVHADMPRLRVSFDDAFLEQTASVPQIALFFAGQEQARLWIRWYKLGGEGHRQHWLEKLKNRGRPPLAILGGDTSDRAIILARRLKQMQNDWSGPPPLFLITSATAFRFYPGDNQSADLTLEQWPKLTEVYKDMSFRFCFNTQRIAETVVDFVQENPQVWPEYHADPATLAAVAGQGQGFGSLTMMFAAGHFRPTFLTTLAWNDDRYSQDLADRFNREFGKQFYFGNPGTHVINSYVQYSVGDFYQPNPSEQQMVGMFLVDPNRQTYKAAEQYELLAMPTGAQQARRFLRCLCQQAPMEVRNLVVITGDSINFNNVYRDRDLAWNVLDLPVPLIFFSHRNPVDELAGFRDGVEDPDAFQTTGTQDLLLLRDVIEAFVQAAWSDSGWSNDVMAVRNSLRLTRWHQGRMHNPRVLAKCAVSPRLFDGEGNRQPRTGEHVVWLQPVREYGRILPKATLSVWRIDLQSADELTWKRIHEPIVVDYNQGSALEVRPAHGRD